MKLVTIETCGLRIRWSMKPLGFGLAFVWEGGPLMLIGPFLVEVRLA
jgi:hypothetical protein